MVNGPASYIGSRVLPKNQGLKDVKSYPVTINFVSGRAGTVFFTRYRVIKLSSPVPFPGLNKVMGV